MTFRASPSYAVVVAAAVRAELARQQRTATDLAAVLGVTPHTAGRRLAGVTPFNVVEIMRIAAWLDVPTQTLLPSRDGDAA